MPEVNMDSAKLAETALSLCSSAPHDFGGIVFKNCSSIMHNPYKATVLVEKQGG